MASKRLFVVAGEASADRLAAAVIRELPASWSAHGVGGPVAARAGLDVWLQAEALSLIGLFEVVTAIPRVLALAAGLIRRATALEPSAVLLIDLPDFNLRLGPILRRLLGPDVPIIYFGAPQAWAWRPHRAAAMARWVDRLACLYPFEVSFFRDRGVAAEFVGHPRAQAAAAVSDARERTTIAILPGSRRAELRRHLPEIRRALPELAAHTPDYRRVLPVAPTLDPDEIRAALGAASSLVELTNDDALSVLAETEIAWVASGTAVTEAVLCGALPIVFYRVNPATYIVARNLISVPFISMANLLAGERLVPELVQDAFSAASLMRETRRYLGDPELRATTRQRLSSLASALRGDGAPGARVAHWIASSG